MKEQTIYYEINYSDKKETFFSFLLLRQKEADILKEITSLGVILETNLSVKSPKELAVESEEAKNRLWESKEELIKKLMKWKQKIPFFQFNEEILLSKLSREKAKELLIGSNHILVIRAWISREDQERIVHELTQKIPRDQLAITFEDPTDEEIKEQVL